MDCWSNHQRFQFFQIKENCHQLHALLCVSIVLMNDNQG